MTIDKQLLFQHAARMGQRIVSAGNDVLDLRHGIQRAIASIADELTRGSHPARELQPVAETQAVRTRRPASRSPMR